MMPVAVGRLLFFRRRTHVVVLFVSPIRSPAKRLAEGARGRRHADPPAPDGGELLAEVLIQEAVNDRVGAGRRHA